MTLLLIIGGFFARVFVAYCFYWSVRTSEPPFYRFGEEPSHYYLIGLDFAGVYEIAVGDKFFKDAVPPSLLRSSERGVYSIGPDGIDDSLVTIYDPTNGVVSRGDILLP